MTTTGNAVKTVNDQDLFRRIESEVLDRHHLQLGLLRRDGAIAVESLLKCYAQILRDLRTGKILKSSDDARSQTANEGLRGLGHCLRWIKECCPSKLIVPTPAPDVLAREALELLRWGVAYASIWNQHSAYSRHLVDVEIDERNKIITFLPQRSVASHFFCTQIEAKNADDERLARTYPDSQLADLAKAWYDSVAMSGMGMSFDDATICKSGAIEVVFSWMKTTCLPELTDATPLMGCTVGDLRRVLATLYVFSLFVTKLEDVADDEPMLGVSLQPCVMARPRDSMIGWLARLSGVPAESVEAILSVLTFDPAHQHVTLAQQPFVRSDDGRLLFLPRMALFLDLPRMYVGALNKKTDGKSVYSQTINTIESVGVESIANDMRNALPARIQIAEKPKLMMPNGQVITPDLVIVSNCDREVLVIDVKYATPPFGPSDIHRDVEEMAKWKSRMTEYVTGVQTNPGLLANHFQWNCQQGATVFGIILTRWPLPIPVDFAEPVGAVDWPSLREHIQQTHPSSIRDLMKWANNRPDVDVPIALIWTEKDVQVGEWKYRYSVLAPLPKKSLFDLTQKLAYRLWEERGKPLWDDMRDWSDAEYRIASNPYVAVEMELGMVASALENEPRR